MNLNNIGHLSIRQRISLLVIVSFIAILAIGGYAVLQSRGNAVEVRSVTEGVVPSALASADLVSQLKQVQLATMALVSAPDLNIATQAKDKLTAKKALLQGAIDLQAQQATGKAQQGLVEQAKESLGNYFSAIDASVGFKLAGQQAMADANRFANVAMYQDELEAIVDTLRVEKNRAKDSAIEALNDSLASTTVALGLVTLFSILVLGTLGMLLYRQIVGPIAGMQAMMSEIAASQDFTRRVPVEREDEIGRSIIAFNAMIAKIEEGSSLLRQKTHDIQTMLANIPQGILTVVDGNRIHPEYSAYLETIFETQDIVGRDLMELVFSGTNLGADILSQVEAVSGACLGEDVMNFEFNGHLMVGEIEKTMADGRVKILDLSWSPITDEADTTVRLMLCVRDVTELRQLAAEANEQKRELETIGEILAVSQEKFHEFIVSAIEFIDENELIIHQHPDSDAEAIAQLFRNMHTVKGNARTYGLKHLTNIVHEAEQSYNELRDPRPVLAWDQATLLAELAGVKAALDRYARINEVSLGRKGPGRRGSVERFLMVDKAHIQESLQRLETVNTANLHELLAVRNAVRSTLRLLGTEAIGETLASVLESLPSLAKELGKDIPVVSIEDNGYVVHSQASGLLKNVFMHLIRNAMDHGIETPDVRRALGKPAAGTIRLEMGVEAGMLQFALSDEGRGLSLGRSRNLAIDRGLLAADSRPSDEEIAQLIFRAGFSTADKVTEVSGRGVGMDAVLNFVKREQGKIEIHFTDDDVGADIRHFKMRVFLPASFAVKVDDGSAKLSQAKFAAHEVLAAPVEADSRQTQAEIKQHV